VSSPAPVAPDRFAVALAFVLAQEGGSSANPTDPGGPSNYGVTQITYDRYRDFAGKPRQAVKLIGSEEIEAVYRMYFWDTCACGKLPAPLDLVVFDAAVNCGPARAVRWLQRALWIKDDAVPGPGTVGAAKIAETAPVALAAMTLRREFYKTAGQGKPGMDFVKGWLARLDRLKAVVGLG
jgi:lysozyme family protein